MYTIDINDTNFIAIKPCDVKPRHDEPSGFITRVLLRYIERISFNSLSMMP